MIELASAQPAQYRDAQPIRKPAPLELRLPLGVLEFAPAQEVIQPQAAAAKSVLVTLFLLAVKRFLDLEAVDGY